MFHASQRFVQKYSKNTRKWIRRFGDVCIVSAIVDLDVPGKVWDFMTSSMLRDCLTSQALWYIEVFHLSVCQQAWTWQDCGPVNTVKFIVAVVRDLKLRLLSLFLCTVTE